MTSREIVLDTETTGLSAKNGDRIIDIGLVELQGLLPTGQERQWYLNPERLVGRSIDIHHLSDEFLADKPRFAEIVDELLAFIGTDTLVIHNVPFDLSFLNVELQRLDRPEIPLQQTLDTIELAKRRYPGTTYSLEALCRRFDITITGHHSALLDARLLAQCYLELCGGRQTTLDLSSQQTTEEETLIPKISLKRRTPYQLTTQEKAAHQELLKKLDNPIWEKILTKP